MTRIQLRRAAAASWTSVNPVLALGEVGLETDTYKLKVGDGTSLWNNLPYFVHSWDDLLNRPSHLAAGGGQANGFATLDSNAKVPANQLPNSIMEYQGTWNATTNTPTLADGDGSAYTGNVYRVSTGGTRNLGSGSISFNVGDYVIYNGSAWEKSDTTDAVSSVAGRTGDVTLTVADIGSNTTTALGVGSVELGHASDTTLSRASAGVLAVEGVNVVLANDSRLTDARTPTAAGQVADMFVMAFGATTVRATGTGDFPFGVKLQRALTLSSVTFRCATADASGNLVVELQKNGSTVSGTSTTIAAASQVAGGTSTGTWGFAAGDVLTVVVTGIGTTPGKGLVADIKGLTA